MITFFKPTQSNRGALLSVNYIAKADKLSESQKIKGEKGAYFNLVKQNGWNEKSGKNGNGTFSGGAKLTVKFAVHEMAGIIQAIQKNISLATVMATKYVFHDSLTHGINITFEPNFKKTQVGDKWESTGEQNGFAFRITKTNKKDTTKENIGIVLNWAELKLLQLYLEDALTSVFGALFNEDINRAKTFNAKKDTNQIEPAPEMNEDGQVDSSDDFPE